MATLTIKNFPDELYEKIRELARRERRSIGKQVIHLLTQALEGEKTHSILELCGLGKEIWGGSIRRPTSGKSGTRGTRRLAHRYAPSLFALRWIPYRPSSKASEETGNAWMGRSTFN